MFAAIVILCDFYWLLWFVFYENKKYWKIKSKKKKWLIFIGGKFNFNRDLAVLVKLDSILEKFTCFQRGGSHIDVNVHVPAFWGALAFLPILVWH